MECFGHFLQSREWESFEQLEDRRTFWREGEGWHLMAVLHQTPFGPYLFCPYGPAVRDGGELGAEELEKALGSLRELAREVGAFFVRIEPTLSLSDRGGSRQILEKAGAKKSHDLDPAHTWILDLDGGIEVVLGGVEKSKVRDWRKLEKKGVTTRQTKDPAEIKILSSLLGKLGEARKFTPQNEAHLRRQMEAGFATLYVAEIASDRGDSLPIAAALVHDYRDTRFYMHAAADQDYVKMRAAIGVTLQTIVDAEAAGTRHYDFWGITTSDDPKHPWYGFTQYKKSFGGRQVDYAGTWDLPVKRTRYRIYELVRAVNRKLRKR